MQNLPESQCGDEQRDTGAWKTPSCYYFPRRGGYATRISFMMGSSRVPTPLSSGEGGVMQLQQPPPNRGYLAPGGGRPRFCPRSVSLSPTAPLPLAGPPSIPTPPSAEAAWGAAAPRDGSVKQKNRATCITYHMTYADMRDDIRTHTGTGIQYTT